MFGLGPMELMIVGIIALLLFGQRLPEVMRSLGKGMVEFKKGMNDFQDEIRQATNPHDSGRSVTHRPPAQEDEPPSAPKFEPPTSTTTDSSFAAAPGSPADPQASATSTSPPAA